LVKQKPKEKRYWDGICNTLENAFTVPKFPVSIIATGVEPVWNPSTKKSRRRIWHKPRECKKEDYNKQKYM